MKNSIITTTVVPILGTLVTAFQVTREIWACILFIVIAMIVGIALFIGYKRKTVDNQKRVAGIICISIMFVTAIIGIITSRFQHSRNEMWDSYLKGEKNRDLQELIEGVDKNDGPAQMKLSDYYYDRNDFHQARYYAQMAADNGNSKGYERLILLDYWGWGGKMNFERAFSNILRAQQKGYTSYTIKDEHFLERLTGLQKAALEESLRDQERILAIKKDIASTIAPTGRLLDGEGRFAFYHDELVSLALKGFLPATECLLLEAWISQDSLQCRDYAKELYSAGRIPTAPGLRHQILGFVDKGGNYRITDYKNHIANNDYLLVVTFDPNEKPEKRRTYSDSLLVQEYELFRAQYEWYTGLNNGEIDRIDYLIVTDSDVPILCNISKELLRRNIEAIKERANHLGELDPKHQVTDLEITAFKTSFY